MPLAPLLAWKEEEEEEGRQVPAPCAGEHKGACSGGSPLGPFGLVLLSFLFT